MKKSRLEAFSDGVIAIIITIMVLELKVPHSADIGALKELFPVLFSYLLSFIYVGIYWNNHHHMLYVVEKINGKVLWANLALLFSLSLIPFVTDWMGENHFAKWPVICYGIVLVLNALTFTLLSRCLVKSEDGHSKLAEALGQNWKSKVSTTVYFVGIIIAFFAPLIGLACYIIIGGVWFIPDNRIERKIADK